jgi:hypothetical protein
MRARQLRTGEVSSAGQTNEFVLGRGNVRFAVHGRPGLRKPPDNVIQHLSLDSILDWVPHITVVL